MLVSLGRKPLLLPLPNLSGLILDDAKEKIRAWGLNAGRIYSKKDPSKPKFQVISTSPSPYTQVRKGDVINLLISSGNDEGTATEKDLKKFEVYSGLTAKAMLVNESLKDSPALPISPPQILIAEDGKNTNINKPTKKIADNSVDNEKEISFVMPDGFMPKEVKFIYISSHGRKQIYSGTHKPLDLIKVKVPATPGGKVQIYINDVPIEERNIE